MSARRRGVTSSSALARIMHQLLAYAASGVVMIRIHRAALIALAALTTLSVAACDGPGTIIPTCLRTSER